MSLLTVVPAAAAEKGPNRAPAAVKEAKPAEETPQSAEDLFKRYKPAVVKIVIRQQQIPIATGTGFFVSGDGRLVTNYHVIKNTLKAGSFTAEFILSDGEVVKDFLVAKCRDDRNIDLCHLQLPAKPKSWFEPSDNSPAPGETVYVIGHPQGLDFSITNGIISALRRNTDEIDEVQFSAPISPGNSGGPIFNSKGQLVGVVSKFVKEGQNLNFGIQVSEVKKYAASHSKFVTIGQNRKNQQVAAAGLVKKWVAEDITPAKKLLNKGKPLDGLEQFKDAFTDFGKDNFRFKIPKTFDSCSQVTGGPQGTALVCTALGRSVILTVGRGTDSGSLMDLNGKKLSKEKPLPLVEELMREGIWEQYEKKLSPSNKKYLFSVSTAARCEKLGKKAPPKAFFGSAAEVCRYSTYNDLEPDAFSYRSLVRKDGRVYGFNVWMEDATLAPYFVQALNFAIASAAPSAGGEVLRTIASDETPESNFTVQLSGGFGFVKSQNLSGDTTAFIYQKTRSPAAAGSPSLFMVNYIRQSFPPKDLMKTAQDLFQGTLEGFGATIDFAAVQSRSVQVDSMPGMIQTGQARKNESGLAVFHSTILAPGGTYMIFGFSDPKEGDQALQEFEKMTLSLKRK